MVLARLNTSSCAAVFHRGREEHFWPATRMNAAQLSSLIRLACTWSYELARPNLFLMRISFAHSPVIVYTLKTHTHAAYLSPTFPSSWLGESETKEYTVASCCAVSRRSFAVYRLRLLSGFLQERRKASGLICLSAQMSSGDVICFCKLDKVKACRTLAN